MGEIDIQKAQHLIKNIKEVASSQSSQKLTFIMDTSKIVDIRSSASKEINLIDLSLRKYWSKFLFIYDGMGKVIMDMYELHKPEYIEDIEKINDPQVAIDYAVRGKLPDSSFDDYLNSLSKEELIKEIKNLKANKIADSNQMLNVLNDLSWNGKDTDFLDDEKDNGFNSANSALQTIIGDFKEVNRELQDLKQEFNEKLEIQLGEVMLQEATLRAIFDSLESIVWMIDADFNILTFNNKFYHHVIRHYNIAPEVGMNLMEQSELAPQYYNAIERINLALTGKEERYRDFYRENGKIIKVVDSKIFPVSVNEDVNGVVCITDDITESYEAKERIKSNERIIASVNKNISEAIYRSSHDKGLIFVNEAFVKMFGFENKEELYNHVQINSIYANPDDRERLGNLLIKKKEVTNLEVQFRRKNGETFTGLISSMVSEDENGVKYFDGAIRDVTGIKSAQEKLKKQNRELKKLNTELDSFVYSASHDLKAPLSSVKGLINLAKVEKDEEKISNYLDLVDKSINKLDNFIKDIVDLSRNARQEVQSELIDFKEIINDTLENYKYLDNYDKIIKTVNIESKEVFYSDKRRLKVIFNNLISNAIRYYNPYIDDPFVDIYIKTEPKKVSIKISDNGLGIENQYLKKIFDMFFRASNNSKGTGIGLYIVKETIQKVNGKIRVDSEVEKGTTFTVIIPNLKP
jgi:PAS domain S-box-containing protein